ncbi:uncharacterized protein G2W53_003590 [Senna tora]|uniref:CCHC-type domain-containing protein n=1 Tax=Senna tora TaxID=362788 RepID=A0A835CJE1_9FABA|nr:uncharacterized protein G2W53_003590 [Senna tora]
MKFHSDAASILAQIKHNEKQIQLKRRWLLGIATSKSDRKKSKFLRDRFLPESLLREDEVFYESVRADVGKAFGGSHIERENHVLHDHMLLTEIPNFKRLIFSCLDNMTTKGLYLLAVIITGGSVKFEKTRCKLRKIIKCSLSCVLSSKNQNHHQLEIFRQISGLLTNPQYFRDTCVPLSASRSQSNQAAIVNFLKDLNDFPVHTLVAMRRKLKGEEVAIPQLLPCRQGWARDHLIKLVKKISRKMLSQLGGGEELLVPLAKAMAVADLSQKVENGCHNIISNEFYQFSPEVKSLQNEIINAIWLVKNVVGIKVLRNLALFLEPKAEPKKFLRRTFVRLLTEFLFECSDMDSIPKSLLEVVDIINRSSSNTPRGLLQGNIEEEVNCILNVSAETKQIVLDLLPDHGFDEDFIDAYVDQLEESDDDDCDDCQLKEDRHVIHGKNDSMDSNYETESIGQFIPFDFHSSISMGDGENYNSSAVSPVSGSDEVFVKRNDFYACNTGMDPRNVVANLSCDEAESEPRKQKIGKNQYLAIQDVCDETSMLSYNLIGHMLREFANFEGLDLNRSQSLYLRVNIASHFPFHTAAEEHSSSRKDARNIDIVRVVEELIPSFPDRFFQNPSTLQSSNFSKGHGFLPRQGPVVNFNLDIVKKRTTLWSKRVIAALVDWKDMPKFRLQFILNNNWFLQGQVTVKAKYNNFFILEFSNAQDKQFMLGNGPWTVQNSLLAMYDLQPGITVENLKIGKVAVWLRFTGVPMELICNSVALSLGKLAGEVVQLDPLNDMDDNLQVLRVKVMLDPEKPLLMGTFIPLCNGEKIWISCTPERAYRVCEQCGRLGHLDRDCNWNILKTSKELHTQHINLSTKFGYAYWVDTQHVLFECPKRKAQEWCFRGTTMIQVEYNASHVTYHVFEQYGDVPSLSIQFKNCSSGSSEYNSAQEIHMEQASGIFEEFSQGKSRENMKPLRQSSKDKQQGNQTRQQEQTQQSRQQRANRSSNRD